MMTTNPNNEARIKELKQQLQKLHQEKESLFAAKEAVSEKIRSLITDVKSKKVVRNVLTDDVGELKKSRKILNQEIRERVEKVKKLRDEAKKVKPVKVTQDSDRGYGRREKPPATPASIKKTIDELEYKIETGAISFSAERKINLQLKDLRKQLANMKTTIVDWSAINTMSKEIDELKVKADEVHKKIQTQAKESQDKHEDVLVQSQSIDKLKEEEDNLQKEFKKKKKEYTKLQAELKELTGEEFNTKRKENVAAKVKQAQHNAKQLEMITDKKREVEAKIARGEKLTTQDLLILQGAEEIK